MRMSNHNMVAILKTPISLKRKLMKWKMDKDETLRQNGDQICVTKQIHWMVLFCQYIMLKNAFSSWQKGYKNPAAGGKLIKIEFKMGGGDLNVFWIVRKESKLFSRGKPLFNPGEKPFLENPCIKNFYVFFFLYFFKNSPTFVPLSTSLKDAANKMET